MGVVSPESTAIQQYVWVLFQQGIKAALQAISDAQELINPSYKFKVETNLYRPTIEEIENMALVNILVDNIQAGLVTDFSKNHIVTYNIDCYVRGENDTDVEDGVSLIPADEVAVERLHYLCAQVEYGLTKLENYYMGISPGDVRPGSLSLSFSPVEDASQSATPYAPARFILSCEFPYTPKDHENLPSIEQTFLSMDDWASRFIY